MSNIGIYDCTHACIHAYVVHGYMLDKSDHTMLFNIMR